MNDLISRQLLDLWNRYKPTIAVDAIEYDRELKKLLGTNLAEVDTDCISRQQTIGALRNYLVGKNVPCDGTLTCRLIENEVISKLPSAQPEIIYCKDCVKHNKGLGNYEVHPDGSSTWIWKGSACPLVSWRDKAQGHEFDYQFCAYAEKREVTT